MTLTKEEQFAAGYTDGFAGFENKLGAISEQYQAGYVIGERDWARKINFHERKTEWLPQTLNSSS